MLRPLRIKLTLLYLLVAMLLAGFVGVGAYSLLYFYFQNNNDTALKFKMADNFATIGVNLPDELIRAQRDWISLRSNHDQTQSEVENESGESPDDESGEDHEIASNPSLSISEVYEGELTSIFILPLDTNGQLMFNPNPYFPPMDPDLNAVKVALDKGYDLRNSTLSDGSPVRLLTYRVPPASGYGLIQVGKPIADQMRVLNQFVSGMLVIGAFSILLLGFGSWLMAGRSLRTTQYAWDMQQAFVANASHELRTPLTLMRASAEVAQRKSQGDTQQAALMGDIVSEVDHMSQLVEDLLLLSRLDAHQLKLDQHNVFIPDLVAEIQRQFSPLTAEKQVSFINQAKNGTVLADMTRLRQVLIILLDNALRHTPPGGTITVQTAPEGRYLRISVSDSGEGISQEHLKHVFERFYQAESGRSTDYQGAGLGLSIAKSLIDAQGGQIRISSQPGKGTIVTLLLPAGK
jgi:signal transduction histidine kinase